MISMFEILKKDLCGRLGRFETAHGTVETPNIAIVINPNKLEITPRELKRDFGVQMLITNSYIISRSPELKEKALSRGVHALLGTDLPLMTDSGTYQMFSQGGVQAENKKIVHFQKRMKSDIPTMLDVFTTPEDDEASARRKTRETIRRAKEVRDTALVVQGSGFLDLREHCARKLSALKAHYYCIGGVVPYMMAYDFSALFDIICASAFHLPLGRPVHLFGGGHPMMFAWAVALGIDMFDSAAYSLYAGDGRYITPHGTYKISGMRTLPCECPVCSSHAVSELRSKDLLLRHNLHATMGELRRVKEAISEGTLWDLVEMRSRTHPKLLEGFMKFKKIAKRFYEYTPVTKSKAFFWLSEMSESRPEITRHKLWMKRYPKKKVFEIPPFGPVPAEITEFYPFSQYSVPWEEKSRGRSRVEGIDKLRGTADYQFRMRVGKKLFPDKTRIERSRRTNKIRRAYSPDGLLIATIRASDGKLLLHNGAHMLHENLQKPRFRVVITDEAVPFVLEGKSVFCKFVKSCDPELLPGEEVLIVDRKDRLLAAGETTLNGCEIMALEKGALTSPRIVFV